MAEPVSVYFCARMNEEELLTLPSSGFEHVDVEPATNLSGRKVNPRHKRHMPLTDVGNS
jgi:hypothetical protein